MGSTHRLPFLPAREVLDHEAVHVAEPHGLVEVLLFQQHLTQLHRLVRVLAVRAVSKTITDHSEVQIQYLRVRDNGGADGRAEYIPLVQYHRFVSIFLKLDRAAKGRITDLSELHNHESLQAMMVNMVAKRGYY